MIDRGIVPRGYTALERSEDYLFTCKCCTHQARIAKEKYTVGHAVSLAEHAEKHTRT